jgi:hypothetical protein
MKKKKKKKNTNGPFENLKISNFSMREPIDLKFCTARQAWPYYIVVKKIWKKVHETSLYSSSKFFPHPFSPGQTY